MDLTSIVRKMVARPEPVAVILDSVPRDDDDAQSYALTHIAVSTAAALQEWVETADDDLDEGETHAGRLLGMCVGLCDPDQDDEELSDDESDTLDLVRSAAWDYLTAKGIEPDDATLLLDDWDADAAVRIREFLASILPDGDGLDDIDTFAFDSTSTLDAVHKMKASVGKASRFGKRISGKVKVSAKQKLSLRKAGKKAHTATATMKRVKSQKAAPL